MVSSWLVAALLAFIPAQANEATNANLATFIRNVSSGDVYHGETNLGNISRYIRQLGGKAKQCNRILPILSKNLNRYATQEASNKIVLDQISALEKAVDRNLALNNELMEKLHVAAQGVHNSINV